MYWKWFLGTVVKLVKLHLPLARKTALAVSVAKPLAPLISLASGFTWVRKPLAVWAWPTRHLSVHLLNFSFDWHLVKRFNGGRVSFPHFFCGYSRAEVKSKSSQNGNQTLDKI
jgi:hypothetical protein